MGPQAVQHKRCLKTLDEKQSICFANNAQQKSCERSLDTNKVDSYEAFSPVNTHVKHWKSKDYTCKRAYIFFVHIPTDLGDSTKHLTLKIIERCSEIQKYNACIYSSPHSGTINFLPIIILDPLSTRGLQHERKPMPTLPFILVWLWGIDFNAKLINHWCNINQPLIMFQESDDDDDGWKNLNIWIIHVKGIHMFDWFKGVRLSNY